MVQGLGYSIPMGRYNGNFFRAIGFDKPFLKLFADYFVQHIHGEDLNLIYDLFEPSNEQEPAIF